MNCVYAQGVSVRTAVLPKGWRGRVVPWSNQSTGRAQAAFLDPHDCVVSKLVAYRQGAVRLDAAVERRLDVALSAVASATFATGLLGLVEPSAQVTGADKGLDALLGDTELHRSEFDDPARTALNAATLRALAAVTDNLNQSKGDRDPSGWLPTRGVVQAEVVSGAA